MKSLSCLSLLLISAISLLAATAASGDAPTLKPVPFHDVILDDPFWKQRIETNRTESLPMMHQSFEENGNLDNFKKVAGKMEGNHRGFPWCDSDVFKTLEGMAYSLKQHPDANMERKLEEAVTDIAAAQRKDGYLTTYFQLGNIGRGDNGTTEKMQPWEDPQSKHEDYNMGHMMEAAIAHYIATGKPTFLNVARKNSDYLHTTFGPAPKRSIIPGHQEVELALMRLHGLEGFGKKTDYEIAKFYIDERGRHSGGRGIYGEYCQDLRPILTETEPVGHGVRGGYMWAAATDIAAINGDAKMLTTLETLWSNIVAKKMYVTGGMGSGHCNEGFAADYDLSHEYAYNETCAACAMIFWTHRLANLRGDAKYTDVMERILFNGFASGRSIDGKRLYYNNFVKRTDARDRRGIVCCATNIVRTIPTISGYQYAAGKDGIWTHLYMAGKATVPFGDKKVSIQQETNYPWSGDVKITLTPEAESVFTLHVRIPEWAKGATAKVNGETVDLGKAKKGYAPISRTWKAGDTVQLSLPMEIRRLHSDPKVWADHGRVAIARGPVVYCLESNDNPVSVHQIVIPPVAELKASDFKADDLGGIVRLTGKGTNAENGSPVDFTMIPYAVWDNRTHDSGMIVMALEKADAKPGLIDGGRTAGAKVTFSHKHEGDKEGAVNDGILPTPWNGTNGAKDTSIPRFTWIGKKGTKEWIAYEFPKPISIWRSDVFWFNDEKETDFPKDFVIEYWEAGQWKVAKLDADYFKAVDFYAGYHYSTVRFKPVTTTKLRMTVQLKPDKSGGILEWRLPY